MRLRTLILEIEGSAKEITRLLNEALETIEQEQNEVIEVKPIFVKEGAIDGYITLYHITYNQIKLPVEDE